MNRAGLGGLEILAVVRSRGDRPQGFTGIENDIRLGQQIFRRDVESQRRQPASVQPDVATRFQELKKILNFEQMAIALQARARSHFSRPA